VLHRALHRLLRPHVLRALSVLLPSRWPQLSRSEMVLYEFPQLQGSTILVPGKSQFHDSASHSGAPEAPVIICMVVASNYPLHPVPYSSFGTRNFWDPRISAKTSVICKIPMLTLGEGAARSFTSQSCADGKRLQR
jgi:hypothetical protein